MHKQGILERFDDLRQYADWQTVFKALHGDVVYKLSDQPTQVQRDNATRVLTLWNLSLHWVVKLKWKSNYRIPYSPKVSEVMKPFGTLIFHYLELCMQCHSFLPDNPYPTAASWFWAIARESQMNNIFNPITVTGKTQSLAERRKIIDSIKEGINSISKDHAPHEWLLIETALSFNRGDNLDREYFQPFIRAYRHWINAIKSDEWLAVIQENDKLYVRTGQGKGKILLTSPSQS